MVWVLVDYMLFDWVFGQFYDIYCDDVLVFIKKKIKSCQMYVVVEFDEVVVLVILGVKVVDLMVLFKSSLEG